MNTLENPVSSGSKDSDSSKKKSRRVAGRLVSSEVRQKPELGLKETKAVIPAAEIHIGKLVMAEKPRATSSRDRLELPKSDIRPDTMSNQDLLKLSEQIEVNGTNLRRIYETQLIGEKGLRRIVSEYESGGDLKKAIKHEIEEREKDFERDPVMRDTASDSLSLTGAGQQSLEQMIKKAEAAIAGSAEEHAFLRAKASYEKRDKASSYMQPRVINSVFVVIVAILVAIIVLLGLLKFSAI